MLSTHSFDQTSKKWQSHFRIAALHYIQLTTINVIRQNRWPQTDHRVNTTITCAKLCETLNKISCMFDLPGTRPCRSGYSCLTCPMISEERNHEYFVSFNLQLISSTTCSSRGFYALVYKTKEIVNIRMTRRWASQEDAKRFGSRENGNLFAFGATSSMLLDRIVEDALILFTFASQYEHVNQTINIIQRGFRNELIQALQLPAVTPYIGLYSSKLFFLYSDIAIRK